jgi:hypothetical protein
MNPSKEAIEEQAVILIKRHFELINVGNLEAARRQLFCPSGIAENPINVYLETMDQLKPFRLVSTSVHRFEDVRRKRHGRVAAIWVNVVAICSLGERTAEIVVWWFPETNECQISARPSHWVTEKLRGDESPPVETK